MEKKSDITGKIFKSCKKVIEYWMCSNLLKLCDDKRKEICNKIGKKFAEIVTVCKKVIEYRSVLINKYTNSLTTCILFVIR